MRRSDTIAMLRSPLAFGGACFTSQGPSPFTSRACLDEAPADFDGAESGVATLTRRWAAAIRVICLDDRLHEFVTDDVAFVEVDERDPLNLADDFHGLDETREACTGQIYLGNVPGDHGLRAEAQAGQEHFHLFGGGVLRFIEDHERVVQRAAAHEG